MSLPNGIALLALSFFMQETHELAHTSIGRIICGCWGERNFNLWGLCRDCTSEAPLTVLATFAGPAYSFSVIWFGYYLLTRSSVSVKSLGFALIVGSMPFSRILTPLIGGGDEIFGLTRLGVNHSVAWGATLVLVFALAVPPVMRIYRIIENRRKTLWIIGLMLTPFFLVGAIVFGVLQGIMLNRDVLSNYWIMGSPLIVTLWLFFSIGLLATFGKHIPTLLSAELNTSGLNNRP